jgi:hypothetical protein
MPTGRRGPYTAGSDWRPRRPTASATTGSWRKAERARAPGMGSGPRRPSPPAAGTSCGGPDGPRLSSDEGAAEPPTSWPSQCASATARQLPAEVCVPRGTCAPSWGIAQSAVAELHRDADALGTPTVANPGRRLAATIRRRADPRRAGAARRGPHSELPAAGRLATWRSSRCRCGWSTRSVALTRQKPRTRRQVKGPSRDRGDSVWPRRWVDGDFARQDRRRRWRKRRARAGSSAGWLGGRGELHCDGSGDDLLSRRRMRSGRRPPPRAVLYRAGSVAQYGRISMASVSPVSRDEAKPALFPVREQIESQGEGASTCAAVHVVPGVDDALGLRRQRPATARRPPVLSTKR